MFNFLLTDEFIMYLRKSRADIEAEARGADDVLKRHERILIDTAKRHGILIPEKNIYREVITGETIAERVEMQKVLRRVQSGTIRGVLVVEIERLSRGDNIDQGVVSQTFKYSNTLIITPLKIYDPNNEYDEEFLEYGLFQSRREYKTITRRMQLGRKSSAVEGKFSGNVPPYGYDRKKLTGEKGWTLEPHPEESEAVKLIYDLYVHQNKGPAFIASELDRLGYKPRKSEAWPVATIRSLITNPVYAGDIGHKRRAQVKTMRDGGIVKSRPHNENYEKYRGRHPALVDTETWNKAQEKIASNLRPRTNKDIAIQNPFAGILVCGLCGKTMTRRPLPKPQATAILCTTKGCPNIGSYLHFVEEDVIFALEEWLKHYKIQVETASGEAPEVLRIEKAIKRIQEQADLTDNQIDSLRDLLERGVYTADVYIERLQKLSRKKEEDAQKLVELRTELTNFSSANAEIIVPKMENVLNTYFSIQDPEQRNRLLKGAIEKIEYKKTEKGGRTEESQRAYTLKIQPLFFVPDY